MINFISLNNSRNSDLKSVGGKALSLIQLSQIVNIPTGFIISPDIDLNSDEVKDSIIRECNNIGSKYYVVRSSSINEDGSYNSWAGQLESYLWVTKEDLIEKIRLCRESSQNVRAIEYAKERKIFDQNNKVGVIVQKMILSEISGVMFTADPVNGDQSKVILEFSKGLNDKLVQGQIIPESFVLEKESKIDVESKLLSSNQISSLLKIAKQVEAFWSFPCDIEWGIENGIIYIFQCRPITTL